MHFFCVVAQKNNTCCSSFASCIYAHAGEIYVTHSRKRDLIPQKFKIAFLVSARCALDSECNGTYSVAIATSVVELWLFAFGNTGIKLSRKTRLNF